MIASHGLMSTLILSATFAYVIVVCLIGFWSLNKVKDEAGFLVAGRSLGPILGGATLMANQVSAGTTIGLVGFYYFSGISFAWTWPLAWLGLVIAALFVAPKMRGFAGITLSDYFAARFGSEAARVVSAIFIILSYTLMLSAQYQAGGLLFGLVTSMSYTSAVFLVSFITFIYTVMGGMYSNAYIGLIKALILICAYCLAVPFLVSHAGGLHNIAASLYAINPKLTGGWFDVRRLIALTLALSLGLAAAPYEVTAYYSLSDKRTVRVAIGYSFVFQSCIALGVVFCGLCARQFMPYLPNADLATPVLGLYILPVWIGFLLLFAVIVTLTRTGGALLLTSASAVSHDIVLRFFRPGASETEKLVVHRIAIAILAIVPVVIALIRLDLVNFVILLAVKLLAATFFAPVVLGLNWRRGTKAGAISAMIGGPAAVLIWQHFGNPYFLFLEAAEAGVLVSTGLFILVSLVTPSPPESATAPFFASGKAEFSSNSAKVAGGIPSNVE